MDFLSVIINFNLFENTRSGFLPCVILLFWIDEFHLIHLEERLHRCIVPAISLLAHARTSVAFFVLGIKLAAASEQGGILLLTLRRSALALLIVACAADLQHLALQPDRIPSAMFKDELIFHRMG